ncbi:hypothetical protein ABZT49_16105 [Methylobacterium sp. EM32]|uniref:hypothetical protein n=1 Tax=Methylobacterium sp. EM32 TaxID=3163481 RepID=UPI0033A02D34
MIRPIRAEERPVDSGSTPEQALENLRIGLEYFFGETSSADLAAQMDVERARIHEIGTVSRPAWRQTSPSSTRFLPTLT